MINNVNNIFILLSPLMYKNKKPGNKKIPTKDLKNNVIVDISAQLGLNPVKYKTFAKINAMNENNLSKTSGSWGKIPEKYSALLMPK